MSEIQDERQFDNKALFTSTIEIQVLFLYIYIVSS